MASVSANCQGLLAGGHDGQDPKTRIISRGFSCNTSVAMQDFCEDHTPQSSHWAAGKLIKSMSSCRGSKQVYQLTFQSELGWGEPDFQGSTSRFDVSGESVEGWGVADQLSEPDSKHLCQTQSLALEVAKGDHCRHSNQEKDWENIELGASSAHNGGCGGLDWSRVQRGVQLLYLQVLLYLVKMSQGSFSKGLGP